MEWGTTTGRAPSPDQSSNFLPLAGHLTAESLNMSQLIATILCILGIAGLFVLDRDRERRTSSILWVPLIYLLIIGSRSVSSWLGIAPPPDELYGDAIYSSPIDQAVVLVLLALGLMTLIARRRKVGPVLQRSWAILLFYCYGAFSIFWSDTPFFTFKHWTKAVVDLVMALIVLTDLDPVAAIKRLLARAGFILIPLSVLFSKYYPSLGREFDKSWETVYCGVANSKNWLGIDCMIFGLTSLWCLLEAWGERKSPGRTRRLIAHIAMLGMIVVLLKMAYSATATASLALASTVLVAVFQRKPKVRIARVHLAVATALACALLPLFVVPSLVKDVGKDPTFSGRTVIWHILPRFVENPWLGAGYETFLSGPRMVQLKAIIDKTFQEAHNGYLEVWLNLGWIGVSLFALVVVSGYRNAVASYSRDPATGSLRMALLVAVLIEGLTEAPFRMMTPTWFLFLWAITDHSMARSLNPGRERQKRLLRRKGWFGRRETEEIVYANSSLIRDSAITSSEFTDIDRAELPELSRF